MPQLYDKLVHGGISSLEDLRYVKTAEELVPLGLNIIQARKLLREAAKQVFTHAMLKNETADLIWVHNVMCILRHTCRYKYIYRHMFTNPTMAVSAHPHISTYMTFIQKHIHVQIAAIHKLHARADTQQHSV